MAKKISKRLAKKLVKKLAEKLGKDKRAEKKLKETREPEPTVFEGPVYFKDVKEFPEERVQPRQRVVVERPEREVKVGLSEEDLDKVLKDVRREKAALGIPRIKALGKKDGGGLSLHFSGPSTVVPGGTVYSGGGSPMTPEFMKATSDLAKRFTVEDKGTISKGGALKHGLPEKFLHEIETAWKPPQLKQIDEKYPLIEPFAYGHIKWEPKEESLRYYVLEPTLNPDQEKKLNYVKELLSEYLNVNLYEIQDLGRANDYLKEKIEEIINKYSLDVEPEDRALLEYFITRDLLGLDKIEPLMRDDSIEDISCIGIDIPLYLFHRKYGSIKTNVKFKTEEDLNRFLVKIAQKCGRSISVAHPLLDGTLPSGDRVQATYSGGDISTKGSTFTIRKFTKNPLTVTDLLTNGTMPATIAAYLWLAIEYKNSLLIAGSTASGKTTSLNAVSMFIPPESKIVSIEDTAELRLPHENWSPKVARSGSGPIDASGRKMGEVSMFDLLKASFRERPDFLIVGEVRGEEAYVLFQLMASGHPGLSTIHAEDTDALIHRLTTKPLNLSAGLLQSLDLIMFMESTKIQGLEVRRVKSVVEVTGVDLKNDRPLTNKIFEWDTASDTFKFISDKSFILNQIIENKGVSETSLWEELERRTRVLEWLRKTNTHNYEDVSAVISAYYKDPESLLDRISEAE